MFFPCTLIACITPVINYAASKEIEQAITGECKDVLVAKTAGGASIQNYLVPVQRIVS